MYDVIKALSGRDETGAVKASAQMFHVIYGSDGSSRDADELYIEKPEIRIFKDADNIVKVDFIYEFPDDADLYAQYMFLEKFFSPENSIKYSDEEFNLWLKQDGQLMEGRYIPEKERQIIYLDTLVMNIISLNPRGKYTVTTLDKPVMYSLVPVRPGESPSVLRMIYQAEDVELRIETDETVKANYEAALNEETGRSEV